MRKELDMEAIYETLVEVYKVIFFDEEVLERLVRQAAKRVVYIEMGEE